MEKKHVIGIVAVVAVIAALAFPHAQWGMFCLKANETVGKLDRFADVGAILGLKKQLGDDARHYKLDPSKLKVDLTVEERSMGGAVTFTYVLVDCAYDGKKTWSYGAGGQAGKRVESVMNSENIEALKAGGVRYGR